MKVFVPLKLAAPDLPGSTDALVDPSAVVAIVPTLVDLGLGKGATIGCRVYFQGGGSEIFAGGAKQIAEAVMNAGA